MYFLLFDEFQLARFRVPKIVTSSDLQASECSQANFPPINFQVAEKSVEV